MSRHQLHGANGEHLRDDHPRRHRDRDADRWGDDHDGRFGNYTFTGVANGTYTVSPSKSGYRFTPSSTSVTITGTSVGGVNFSAQAVALSGTIAGTTGVTVTLTGGATTTTDGSGNYSFSPLANGTYTVTPSKIGYMFSPASQSVTVAGNSVGAVNFTATLIPTYTIAGNISPAANGSGFYGDVERAGEPGRRRRRLR